MMTIPDSKCVRCRRIYTHSISTTHCGDCFAFLQREVKKQHIAAARDAVIAAVDTFDSLVVHYGVGAWSGDLVFSATESGESLQKAAAMMFDAAKKLRKLEAK